MDENILERCYARQAKHLSLDEAIEFCYQEASSCAKSATIPDDEYKHILTEGAANLYQIYLNLLELRCSRNDIAKLKDEVKELRETNRHYSDKLRDCGVKDDEIIKLEDFIKAFYKHLEEHHNEENKDS